MRGDSQPAISLTCCMLCTLSSVSMASPMVSNHDSDKYFTDSGQWEPCTDESEAIAAAEGLSFSDDDDEIFVGDNLKLIQDLEDGTTKTKHVSGKLDCPRCHKKYKRRDFFDKHVSSCAGPKSKGRRLIPSVGSPDNTCKCNPFRGHFYGST